MLIDARAQSIKALKRLRVGTTFIRPDKLFWRVAVDIVGFLYHSSLCEHDNSKPVWIPFLLEVSIVSYEATGKILTPLYIFTMFYF